MSNFLENQNGVMLFEGSDDREAINNLLLKHDIQAVRDKHPRYPNLMVDCDGVDKLLHSLVDHLNNQKFVAIIVDADDNPLGRWQSVSAKLRDSGYIPPSELPPDGWVGERQIDGYRAGVWMMPDNSSRGALEEFVQSLIPSDGQRCWDYTEDVVKIAKSKGATFKCPPADIADHTMKARLRSWLAWQDEPGLPFGAAIMRYKLEHDSPTAQRFVAWVKKLFQLAEE